MIEHLQINDVAPCVHYTCNGVQAAFIFPFAVFKAADLEVWVNQTRISSGYTVSGAGISSGGSVLFAVPPAQGARLTLRRCIALARVTDFQTDGIIRAKTLNDELDYQVAAVQQVADDVSRCVQRPFTSASTADLTLPDPAGGKLLGWNAAGTGLENLSIIGGFAATPLGAAIAMAADPGRVRELLSLRIHAVDAYGAKGDGITDDTAAIQAAIDATAGTAEYIYFPPGAYVVASNLAGMHDVDNRFWGPGNLVVDGNVFSVDPDDDDGNTLYVSPLGSDANDGLSAARPFATIGAALAALRKWGPVLNGQWAIQLAAGTYGGRNTLPKGLRSRNRILIKGPAAGHPNVPTAILDGTAGAPVFGLEFEGWAHVEVRDVKVVNYSSTAHHCGISADRHCNLLLTNVHASANRCGAQVQSAGVLQIAGGKYEANVCGARVIGEVEYTLGYAAAALAAGPIFANNTGAGWLAQECCSGHADFCTFSGNAKGVQVLVGARCNANGSDFRTNGVGVEADFASNFYDAGVAWNTATATANAVNFKLCAFASEVNRHAGATSEARIAVLHPAYSRTGTTASGTAATPWVMKGHDWDAATKAFRVRVAGSATGAGGSKIIWVRIDGNILSGEVIPAGLGSYEFETRCTVTSANNQRVTSVLRRDPNVLEMTEIARTLTLHDGQDHIMTIGVQLASAADTLTVDCVEVWREG